MHAPSDEVAEDVRAETGRATAADISVSANASRPTRRTTRRRYISARAQHKASSAPCHADIYHQLLANVSFSAVRHSATTCARPLRANISAPPEKHRMSQRGAISRTLAINCCFRPASGKGGAHWADGDRAQIRTAAAAVWEQRRPRAAFTPLVFVAEWERGSARCARLVVDRAGGGRTGPSCYLHRLTRAATMSRDGRPDLGQATVDLSLISPADRAYSETAPERRPAARRPNAPPTAPSTGASAGGEPRTDRKAG